MSMTIAGIDLDSAWDASWVLMTGHAMTYTVLMMRHARQAVARRRA